MTETRSFMAWTDELVAHTTPHMIANAMRLPSPALLECNRRIKRICQGVSAMLNVIHDAAPPQLRGYLQEAAPSDADMFGIMYEEGMVHVLREIDPELATAVENQIKQCRDDIDYIDAEMDAAERRQTTVEVVIGLQFEISQTIRSLSPWIDERHMGTMGSMLWGKFVGSYARKTMDDLLIQENPTMQEMFRQDLEIGFERRRRK